jgi:hypothetical protein
MKGEDTMKTRLTFVTMAAMATLTVGLLGNGIARAGNPCVRACRTEKADGMRECVALAGCNAVQRACKKECRTQYFGEERRDCYDQCDEAKTECKEHADACKDDCKTEFLSCKIDCVDKGF